MAERKVLGVDPGSSTTGWAVVSKGYRPIDYGCIRPPKGERLSRRRALIFEGINYLIDLHRPDWVAVERPFVDRNPQSALKLGMAFGVVVLAATLREIPVYQYPPSLPKRAVGAGGRGSKEQVQKMVQITLGLPQLPTPQDAADALAIAICHLNLIDSPIQQGEEM